MNTDPRQLQRLLLSKVCLTWRRLRGLCRWEKAAVQCSLERFRAWGCWCLREGTPGATGVGVVEQTRTESGDGVAVTCGGDGGAGQEEAGVRGGSGGECRPWLNGEARRAGPRVICPELCPSFRHRGTCGACPRRVSCCRSVEETRSLQEGGLRGLGSSARTEEGRPVPAAVSSVCWVRAPLLGPLPAGSV